MSFIVKSSTVFSSMQERYGFHGPGRLYGRG
jgi:hypothetical protein